MNDPLRAPAEKGAVPAGRTKQPRNTDPYHYDGEALASARGYAFVSLAGALWSLRNAAQEWQDAVRLASACQVVLLHDARGEQRWSDVVRNNAHDAFHHEWDIRRSLA